MRFAVLGLFLVGCSRASADATPEGALRLWLDTMEESVSDARKGKDAYALLDAQTKANLEERAARTGRVQGRRVEGWEMLAEGRFGLRFRPKAMKTSFEGDKATVEVVGVDPKVDHATVHTSHEGEVWRVSLDLPDLEPLPKRSD